MKSNYKKLSRSSKKKVLGGVAGGLGNYLNIDPTVVRVLFVILTLFNGMGALVYVILWVILPSDKAALKDEALSADMVKDNLTDMKGTVMHVASEVKKQVQPEEKKK